jgi:Na+/phosphate symporter
MLWLEAWRRFAMQGLLKSSDYWQFVHDAQLARLLQRLAGGNCMILYFFSATFSIDSGTLQPFASPALVYTTIFAVVIDLYIATPLANSFFHLLCRLPDEQT